MDLRPITIPAIFRPFITASATFPLHARYPCDAATATSNTSLLTAKQKTDSHAGNGQKDDQKTEDKDLHHSIPLLS
uniref:Uncharacterized protein n=1 Tax=Candidatus Kentrum sp. MB TaxID=2138164 RepID=A0A450XPM4_9GAMM|nr:MAG: hypothetical protein BECKMB1821G_GA0114241_108115 [Candidatus Kentron sp. MB]